MGSRLTTGRAKAPATSARYGGETILIPISEALLASNNYHFREITMNAPSPREKHDMGHR